MENSNIKTLIIENIKSAWVDVKYPGDQNIFVDTSYDDEGIVDYFTGTTWLDHEAEILREYSSAISSFFSKEAYHYWLAAYLIAAVNDPQKLSQGVTALIYSFIPPDEDWRKRDFHARVDLLTNKQKLVIISVLEFLSKMNYDPKIPDSIRNEKLALQYFYENTQI